MPSKPYLHDHPEFADLIKAVAADQRIDPFLAEKDYWLMHCLYGLQQAKYDFQLKGGTSLSKGFSIIDRFSEDIDIHITPPKDMNVRASANHEKEKDRESRKAYYDHLAKTIKIPGIVKIERDTLFDSLPKYFSGGIRLFYPAKFASDGSAMRDSNFKQALAELEPKWAHFKHNQIYQWAWEFLRRNPAYIQAIADLDNEVEKQTKEHKEFLLKKSQNKLLKHSSSVFLNPSQTIKSIKAEEIAIKYGLTILLSSDCDMAKDVYEPLISKELFDECQAVLKGWHKKPFQYAGKEFVFRGLITCATTGRVVTASEQKRIYKSGKTVSWTYLRTWNPDNPEKLVWVREDKILAEVEDIFASLYIPPERLEAITAHIRATDKTERDFLRRQMLDLKRDYSALQTRLDGLMDLLLDGTIDRKEFEQKKLSLRDRQADIRARMAAHEEGDDKFKEALITLLQITAKAAESFRGSTVDQKRKLVGFAFANLQLKGSTLCYSLKEPFCWFTKCQNLDSWSG